MEHDPFAKRNFAIIALLGVIWGGTFMVVAIALEGYGPITVACARTSLGALAMHLLRLALGAPMPRPDKRLWMFLLLLGLLNTALPFTLLSWAQQYVTSAFVGIAIAALPLFILPLAYLFSDEFLNLRRVLGVLTGFAGALVLIGPGLGEASIGGGWPELACLAAIISYAVASILTRQCPPIEAVTMAAITLTVGAALLIPAMLLTEGIPTWQAPRPSLALLILGLFPTAMAAYLRIIVVRSSGSVFMTLVNYQIPLWAMLFGALVLNEALPSRFFAALALILAGLVISRWQTLRRVLSKRNSE